MKRCIIALILIMAYFTGQFCITAQATDNSETESSPFDTSQSNIPSTSELLALFGYSEDQATMDNWADIMYGKAVGPWNQLEFEIPTTVESISSLNKQYNSLMYDMTNSGYGKDFELSVPEFTPGYSQSITELFDSTFGDIPEITLSAELPQGWTMANIMASANQLRDNAYASIRNDSAFMQFYDNVYNRVSFESVMDRLDTSAYTKSYADRLDTELASITEQFMMIEPPEPRRRNDVFEGFESIPTNVWEATVLATKYSVEREGIEYVASLAAAKDEKMNKLAEAAEHNASVLEELNNRTRELLDDTELYRDGSYAERKGWTGKMRIGETSESSALQKIEADGSIVQLTDYAVDYLTAIGQKDRCSEWKKNECAYAAAYILYWGWTDDGTGTGGLDKMIAAANDPSAPGHEAAEKFKNMLHDYGVDVERP